MASVNVIFRKLRRDESQGVIVYKVMHGRRVRSIESELKIRVEEWDYEGNRIMPGSAASLRVEVDLSRFGRIIAEREKSGLPYSSADVVAAYKAYCARWTIFRVLETAIERYRGQNRIRTAMAYRQALNSFSQFREGEDLMIDELTPEIVEAYQACLRQRGNSLNTISFYMRILRAAYNQAVEGAGCEDLRPFRRVFTGLAKTKKRAVSLAIIKRIKALDLRNEPEADYARDMFLLSFYLRGMSLVDMAFLRKTSLKGRRLIYQRHKTGQRLEIEWRKEMQEIVDKYPRNSTGFLLPIITKKGVNEYVAYRKAGCRINMHLRAIAKKVGAPGALTLYVARHSWASAAKSKRVPLSVICQAMGHDSETTTQIYLSSLDTSVVDRANSLILAAL